MGMLLIQIQDSAEDILDDARNIEVSNHASEGADWLTIENMANPKYALNNCWSVSSKLVESLTFSMYGDINKVDTVTLEHDGWEHCAVLLENEEEKVVVDFTARQFDPAAAFPTVMPFHDWRDYIEKVADKTDLSTF